jgi:phosphohistidine phosphatase
LGEIVSRLIGMNDAICPVRKGSVWWLRARLREGQFQTVLMTVASPDLISRAWDDRS